MKILYLSGSYVPSRRASSIHVMRMCQAMASLGHEITLVTKENAAIIEPGVTDDYAYYGVKPNFTIQKLSRPNTRGGGLRFTWEMYRLLSAFDTADTLVYSRELFGVWIAAKMGFQVVLEEHTLPASWLSVKLHKQLFRSRRLARFVVISCALRDLFAEKGFLSDVGRVLIAHDAADPIAVDAGRADELFPENGKVRLGYVGHLYPGRGVDILLDVASRLESCELHLIGGTDEDLAFWQGQQIPENVFFHGFVNPGELGQYFSGLDILLMPYQERVIVAGGKTDTARWMSPLKMFEYMATGKPIISSDLSVLREVLTDGQNALLVPPDDIDAWETAVRRLQSDPGLGARIGRQACEDFQKNYTWDARAKKVLQGLSRK